MMTEKTSFPAAALALEALLARQSVDLPIAPAPEGEALESILKAGLCAPDHGRLRPWRWIVIQGSENCSALGEKTAQALKRQDPNMPEKKLERLIRRFAQAPMIIGLGAAFTPECPIPRKEQEYAVAAGAMNLLNALSFAGFCGIWVSGAYTEDETLRHDLGLERDSEKGGLLGFLLVGSAPAPVKGMGPKKRPSLRAHVQHWQNQTE